MQIPASVWESVSRWSPGPVYIFLSQISRLWFIAPSCFWSLLGGSSLLEVLFVSWMVNMPGSWLDMAGWRLLRGGALFLNPWGWAVWLHGLCFLISIQLLQRNRAADLHEHHELCYERPSSVATGAAWESVPSAYTQSLRFLTNTSASYTHHYSNL